MDDRVNTFESVSHGRKVEQVKICERLATTVGDVYVCTSDDVDGADRIQLVLLSHP